MTVLADAYSAARSLGDHPQDHGWRELYRLFAYGLEQEAPDLGNTVTTSRKARSECSFTHLMTLLGIAVKKVGPASFDELVDARIPPAQRLAALEVTLRDKGGDITEILTSRQNSFTAARRVLVVQIILGAYFGGGRGNTVDFADLGTGLGVLPRQLNSQILFDRFSADLRWNGRQPLFQPIPFAARHGVDRGPRPDDQWVHACYGATEYYADLYRELELSLDAPGVMETAVRYHEFDILKQRELARFIRRYQINAVNLSYVLYEIEPERRALVIDVLRKSLRAPEIIIVTEPVAELTKPGCTVTVYDDSRAAPQQVCMVSDGHFRGDVLPLDDFESFVDRHPVLTNP
ncbi:hypothetical protein [Paractinoplanes lichenicola]|uniref:Uncharacterized protein n=1 Tax=Paractinoplanes lichenicola TaxID=2802976 RepID=A0ABS1VVL7_9ACTN|nr:hypothetical protein [Actinoplanes lichenicola]MBL7258517.1 hypothetical protein [Actinoplanes lichenicola]